MDNNKLKNMGNNKDIEKKLEIEKKKNAIEKSSVKMYCKIFQKVYYEEEDREEYKIVIKNPDWDLAQIAVFTPETARQKKLMMQYLLYQQEFVMLGDIKVRKDGEIEVFADGITIE